MNSRMHSVAVFIASDARAFMSSWVRIPVVSLVCSKRDWASLRTMCRFLAALSPMSLSCSSFATTIEGDDDGSIEENDDEAPPLLLLSPTPPMVVGRSTFPVVGTPVIPSSHVSLYRAHPFFSCPTVGILWRRFENEETDFCTGSPCGRGHKTRHGFPSG